MAKAKPAAAPKPPPTREELLAMLAAEGYAVERWVYIGTRVGQSGNGFQAWLTISDQGDLEPDDAAKWYTRMVKAPILGAIYEVPVLRGDDKRTVRPGLVKWTGEKWTGGNRLIEWATAEEAALASVRERKEAASKRSKAMKSNPDLWAGLEGLARAYRRADSAGRRWLLAETIRIITGGWF